MKKLISMFLALAMILSLSTAIFAADTEPSTTKLIIEKPASSTRATVC